jgi:hypothetical protein
MNDTSILRSRFVGVLGSFGLSLIWGLLPANAAVSIEKLPEARLQPQTIAAPDGTHLPCLAGDPNSADVVYRRQRGGALAWQVFDASGEPTADKGRRDDLPAWSFATTCARPDGNFVILH